MTTPIQTKEEILKLPSDQDISGRNLGAEELALLKEVLDSGVLNSTKGTKVAQFETEFAKYYGASHAIAIASGSAAVHAAINALQLKVGDEIITTPITDMGALTPIVYEGCVPVFADIDPFSYNVTAETIRKRITPKTKAVIVTHLFGNPCDMPAIMKLAREKNIKVIEDCAQAFVAKSGGKNVGVIGDIGTFSLQQGKHMTTGEGGILTTENPDYARRMRLFVNKAWGYGDKNPDHYFLALNYRLTELQGAVALAQLRKLNWVVKQRQDMAALLDQKLSSIKGVKIPKALSGATHVYWKYCLDVDKDVTGFDVAQLSQELKNFGIASAPRYIQKPAFRCQVMYELYPDFQNDAKMREEYPGSYQALSRVLVLPWNEFYTAKHVDFIADKILQSIEKLSC